MHTIRIHPPRHSHALLAVLVASTLVAACGGGGDDGSQPTTPPDASTPAPSTTADEDPTPSDGTPIRITFGDTELTGRLDDNATARDLAAQLPLTLTFRDHNGVEKTAPLPRDLPAGGATGGHDPAAGDIGYWAPDGDLVLYYDDAAPAFDGIVRIGEFDGTVETLARQTGELSVTVERAE